MSLSSHSFCPLARRTRGKLLHYRSRKGTLETEGSGRSLLQHCYLELCNLLALSSDYKVPGALYLEVLWQLWMVIQRSICRNSYKLTFYSGSVGSPYCVFGCQLQVVVFLSAPSLIQFCTDVILNVQIFRCVWTQNLAEVGLWALWNKQIPHEFVLPCIVWQKNENEVGRHEEILFFCIQ